MVEMAGMRISTSKRDTLAGKGWAAHSVSGTSYCPRWEVLSISRSCSQVGGELDLLCCTGLLW